MIHFILWVAGVTNPSGRWYLLWSGSGADLTRLALIGGLARVVRQRAKHHAELLDMHERHHDEVRRMQDDDQKTRIRMGERPNQD